MTQPPYPGPAYPGPSYPGELPESWDNVLPQPGPPPPHHWPPSVPNHPRPSAPARPADGLAAAAIISAVVIALCSIVVTVSAWFARDDYLDAARRGLGGYYVDEPYEYVWFLAVVLFIPAYVITCLWLARVRINTEEFAPWARQTRSRGWVWGGWVCPIVSFWFPLVIVRDVMRPAGTPRSALLASWWSLWLVGICSFTFGFIAVSDEEPSMGAAKAMPIIETVHAAFVIGAALFWIRLIWIIRSDQNRVFASRQSV